jgi:hypothetical protein
MNLVALPDASLLQSVELIQKAIGPKGWHPRKDPDKDRDLLNKVVEIVKNNPLEDYDTLSGALKSGYSIFADPEGKAREVLSLSTGVDSIMHLLELRMVWDEVQHFINAVSGSYGHDDTNVVLATAVTPSANARTFIPQGASVHVIMFCDKLLDLIYEIACLLPALVNFENIVLNHTGEFPEILLQQASKGLESNQHFEKYLAGFYNRHVSKNWENPKLSRQQYLSEDARLIAMEMEDAMRYFVMGHEVAHILENHNRDFKEWHLIKQGVNAVPETVRVAEVNRNWAQEYEADFVGFKIGLGAAIGNGIPVQTYCWAISIFFVMLELLDSRRTLPPPANDAAREAIAKFQTHPPMRERHSFVSQIILSQDIGDGKAVPYDLSVPLLMRQHINSFVSKMTQIDTNYDTNRQSH